MPRFVILTLIACCLLSACKEPTAVRNDVRRYTHHAAEDAGDLQVTLAEFVDHEISELPPKLPLDAKRFLQWRKEQWWNLQDEFAYLIKHEWGQISKLMEDLGRHYGYQVSHWPKLREQVFWLYKDSRADWHHLLMDVSIFVEYNLSKTEHMNAQLQAHYDLLRGEAKSLGRDWKAFLEWRHQYYNRFVATAQAFWDYETGAQPAKLAADLRRYTKHHVGNFAVMVDFSEVSREALHNLPLLKDDLYRFVTHNTEHLARLREQAAANWQVELDNALALVEDVRRYRQLQVANTEALVDELHRFLADEVEQYHKLGPDIKRFWELQLRTGRLGLQQIRAFYAIEMENARELSKSTTRFVAYSSEEWEDFQAHIRRFFTGSDLPFGQPNSPQVTDLGHH